MDPPAPGGASGYEPSYPANCPIDPTVREFITKFYQTSDITGSVDEWVDFFHADATVVMASDKAHGTDEIRSMRQAMWETVATRRHRLAKVFPANFGADGNGGNAGSDVCEFMLFGSAEFRSKTGDESVIDWAGYAQLKREGGGSSEWKFSYYRVYIQR